MYPASLPWTAIKRSCATANCGWATGTPFLYVKGANLRDFNENGMFQEMEKTTNVHIDWQYAGDADWGEQKSLLLAGGDLPDVFFGNNSLLVWIFA